MIDYETNWVPYFIGLLPKKRQTEVKKYFERNPYTWKSQVDRAQSEGAVPALSPLFQLATDTPIDQLVGLAQMLRLWVAKPMSAIDTIAAMRPIIGPDTGRIAAALSSVMPDDIELALTGDTLKKLEDTLKRGNFDEFYDQLKNLLVMNLVAFRAVGRLTRSRALLTESGGPNVAQVTGVADLVYDFDDADRELGGFFSSLKKGAKKLFSKGRKLVKSVAGSPLGKMGVTTLGNVFMPGLGGAAANLLVDKLQGKPFNLGSALQHAVTGGVGDFSTLLGAGQQVARSLTSPRGRRRVASHALAGLTQAHQDGSDARMMMMPEPSVSYPAVSPQQQVVYPAQFSMSQEPPHPQPVQLVNPPPQSAHRQCIPIDAIPPGLMRLLPQLSSFPHTGGPEEMTQVMFDATQELDTRRVGGQDGADSCDGAPDVRVRKPAKVRKWPVIW